MKPACAACGHRPRHRHRLHQLPSHASPPLCPLDLHLTIDLLYRSPISNALIHTGPYWPFTATAVARETISEALSVVKRPCEANPPIEEEHEAHLAAKSLAQADAQANAMDAWMPGETGAESVSLRLTAFPSHLGELGAEKYAKEGKWMALGYALAQCLVKAVDTYFSILRKTSAPGSILFKIPPDRTDHSKWNGSVLWFPLAGLESLNLKNCNPTDLVDLQSAKDGERAAGILQLPMSV
ncbi:uncharacterized protein N7459_001918 [Penicillium hispanicum]|uniref:uncharacterized protein n=1 Tax=Penicillium hispanicum TaxID=1080232 RepID=UPI00254024F0|nr:uncharacterized protein N7459_001918 [Penicillium hispanicum]KAJ5591549.1 hypothetical protein N7459_001918 [Penicillium hispanicum]